MPIWWGPNPHRPGCGARLLPGYALQDSLNCFRAHAECGADRPVRRAAAAQGLHGGNSGLLSGVRDQALDLTILNNVVAEGPFAAGEHALRRQMRFASLMRSRMRSRSASATADRKAPIELGCDDDGAFADGL
jgi:hypothetical protein